MLSKTKKILFLTSGLAGALVLSSAAGVALSACTIEAVNGSGNGSSSDGITLPDTWYNKDINWSDATSLNNLIIDNQGFVYSNKYMTEIIAIMPGYESSTLVIPSQVTSISGYNNVTVSGSTTTKTAAGAFQNLTSITNLKFAGNKVTTIGSRAFYGCTGLQNVVLPSSVTLIDSYAFQNCSALNSINLNNIQYIGTSAFSGAMTNVPTGTVALNLSKAVLISQSAFENATGIGSIDFSKNTTLTQIAQAAFNGCTGLSGDIDLSNATKLITIGNSAGTSGSTFANTAISNVYLPTNAGLRTIASSSFNGCSSLVTVGPKGTTGFTATESFLIIHNKAFYGTKIASIDISSISYTNPLQAGAFSGMTELASVNLGTRITTIPASCFLNCSSLTSLTLPASITSISGGSPTFNTNNASISFSTSDNDTSYPSFYGTGLTSIDLSNVASYQTTTGSTLSLPNALFYNCTSLATVILKEGTTSIGDGTFANTTALTSIYTGSSTSNTGYTATSTLTSVGKFAFWKSGISSIDISAITSTSYNQLAYLTFSECPNLTTIKLPSTLTTIANYAVNETPNLTTVNFGDLPLTSIGSYNFWGCNLTEIDLTRSTFTDISSSTSANTFSALSQNTRVELPSTLWNISSSNAFTYNQTSINQDGTTTTNIIKLNVSFPNGIAPTTTSFTSGNLVDHTMFARINDSLDMSSFTTLRSISKRTFFGGPVTSLTFNASTFANGKFGSNYSDTSATYGYLGFLGPTTSSTSTSLTYTDTSLPFGNMTNLNTINFNKFTNTTTTTANNALANTTSETWNQVARIISSFSKETVESESTTAVNLTDWSHDSITVEVQQSEDSTNLTSNVILKSNINNQQQELITINSNTSSGTFEYAGLTWTVAVNNTNGTITISASEINTYRVLNDTTIGQGPGYKAFFNKTTNSIENEGSTIEVDVPTSNITVTLNVVPAASTTR